jgi:hypothetical protein
MLDSDLLQFDKYLSVLEVYEGADVLVASYRGREQFGDLGESRARLP